MITYPPDYMQDADEGTSFENVQTASVKRHLANDANNEKLLNASIMEMIGHLSKDNKEDYLKHAQPLQTYIDVKDEFDFKHNNYTTTENIDKTPDENVRQLQRELNEAGYTDKFGQPIKEDGLYGGKTAYADDSMKADNPITDNNRYKTATVNDKEYQVEYPTTTKEDLQPKMLDSSEVKLASSDYETKMLSNQYNYDELKELMENGTLSTGDENRNKLKQTMIKCLSANWWSNNNQLNRDLNSAYASKLRKFDDNSFNRAILLNKKDGAKEHGHNAIMLLNKDYEGLVFSFYSQNSGIESLANKAEIRFAVLSKDQVTNLLYGDGSFSVYMTASDHSVKTEKYDRFAYFDLPKGGYNMYHTAVNLYNDPGMYFLLLRNCDDIAIEILNQGGFDIKTEWEPNKTYDNLKVHKWQIK